MELQGELGPKQWRAAAYHLKHFEQPEGSWRWLHSMCADRELFQNTLKFGIISKYNLF